MKKSIVFMIIFFIGYSAFSQSWAMSDNELGVKYKYQVISKDQFFQILDKYTFAEYYAVLGLMDTFDLFRIDGSNNEVFEGTDSVFDGYFYILATMEYFNDEKQAMFRLAGIKDMLVYGYADVDNGEFRSIVLIFGNSLLSYLNPEDVAAGGMVAQILPLDSYEFYSKISEAIDFVNGEN